MTTITIDLPNDVVALLAEQARLSRTSINELAQSFVVRGLEEEEDVEERWDPSLTPDDIAAIEEGLADIAAGRVHSVEDVMLDVQLIIDRP